MSSGQLCSLLFRFVTVVYFSPYNLLKGGLSQGRVKVRRVFRGDRGLEGRSILVEGLGSTKVSSTVTEYHIVATVEVNDDILSRL